MTNKSTQLKSQKVPKLRFGGFSGVWEEKKLGEVADFYKGSGISKDDIVDGGKNKCIRYGELYTAYGEIINNVKSRTDILKTEGFLSKKNDLIIPSSGETALDIASVSCVKEKDILLGGDLNVVRLQGNQSGDFFAYYLTHFQNKNIAKLAQGNSVVHLYALHLKMLKMELPSILEQQKIAEFLGGVDEWIENLREQKENLEFYKKGMMQKIFSQEIRFGDDKGNKFPKWEEKKLEEIVIFSTNSYFEVDDNCKNGYYLADMGSINSEGKLLAKKQTTNVKGLLNKGELIMPNRDIGHGDIIGKVALIDLDNKYVLGSNMYKLSVKNDLPKYLYYLINSSSVNREMRRRSNGTSQLQLIRKDVDSVKVNIPEKKEQLKIAEFLGSIDKVLESKQQQITQAEQWKKGLMQGLFV